MDDCRSLTDHAGPRLKLITESFVRLIGHPLADAETDPVAALWAAPRVILAHGTEPDPIFFYGNRLALDLFEVSAAEIIRMPSRLSAEAPVREERMQLLDRVTRNGFIDDYSGIRVSASGRRFRIEQAIVWNLIDETGIVHGQAATFDRWTPLD